MYATWRYYMDVTDMGSKAEVLAYPTGGLREWVSSSSPVSVRGFVVYMTDGSTSVGYSDATGKWEMGARPALNQEGTLD